MYRQFLNTHVVHDPDQQGKITQNTPAPLPLNAFRNEQRKRVAPLTVQNWPDPPAGDRGGIMNEIVQKFNTHHKFPLKEVKYTPRITDSFYEAEQYGRQQQNSPTKYVGNMTFGKAGNNNGPDPRAVTHELVHANDHQIDNLNASTWQRLGELGRAQINGQHKYPNFNVYNEALKRIQDKIDPTTVFSGGYIPFQQDQQNQARGANVIKQGIQRGRESYGLPNQGANEYLPNRNFPAGADSPHSQQLFDDINAIVRHVPNNSNPPNIQNPNFFLNQASEYPAWISERLTESWDTRSQQNPQHPALHPPEARFLRDVLEDMSAAYPANDYPIMNNYIMQRRNSIDGAFQGQAGYAQGGYVRNANSSRLPLYRTRNIANFIKTGSF